MSSSQCPPDCECDACQEEYRPSAWELRHASDSEDNEAEDSESTFSSMSDDEDEEENNQSRGTPAARSRSRSPHNNNNRNTPPGRRAPAPTDPQRPEPVPRSNSMSDDDQITPPRPLNINSDGEYIMIDDDVTFESIGGLNEHIATLKKMVLLPLINPDLMTKFKVKPTQGVLFHGPPGTGKTLTARALCNEATMAGKKVAFFMRKGADCLSKWVGETEKQLKALFDAAKEHQPSIIFFDEIDGLAPVRSANQDHIHSSVVSTLLCLMDSIGQRGNVIVIGATNRIDCVDPAMRRPGRFDKEFYFPLPNVQARKSILKIRIDTWGDKINNEDTLQRLAGQLIGWSGADIDALCCQSFYNAFERRFPHYMSTGNNAPPPLNQREFNSFRIELEDVDAARLLIIPSGTREVMLLGRPVPDGQMPLLGDSLQAAFDELYSILPTEFRQEEMATDDADSQLANDIMKYVEQPRLLLTGSPDSGHLHFICPAILHQLSQFQIFSIGYSLVDSDGIQGVEKMIDIAEMCAPSVIVLQSIDSLWNHICNGTKDTLRQRISTISRPVLVLATSDLPADKLPPMLKDLFGRHVVAMIPPSSHQRFAYFHKFILHDVLQGGEDSEGNTLTTLCNSDRKRVETLVSDLAWATRLMPVCRQSEMRSAIASQMIHYLRQHPNDPIASIITTLNIKAREVLRNM